MALLRNAMPQEAEDASLDDPALRSAIDYLGSRLYEGDIAMDIAETLGQSPKAIPMLLAKTAYTLAENSDVETENEIKEENLSILGMVALNEVVTIATEAGVDVQSADVSAAFKQMVLMFAQDQGVPQEQINALANALSGVNDQEFAAAAEQVPDEAFDALPDEDVPIGDEEQMAQPEQMGA